MIKIGEVILLTGTLLAACLSSISVSAAMGKSTFAEADETDTSQTDDTTQITKTILLTQSGTEKYAGSSLCVDMTYDDRWLTTDCKAVYNYELAEFAVTLSSNIYEGISCLADGKTITDDKTVLLSEFGFADVTQYTLNGSDYETDPNDTTSVVIGHKPTEIDGQQHDVYIIVVRGTNGTAEEWSSNFDVGNDTVSYTERTGEHPDWVDHDNHKGFDVVANRVMKILSDYVTDVADDPETEQDFLFTGHSRGAGIANILGAEYEAEGYDSCAYTFASPNTTTNPLKYETKCVFNIVNENDFITTLPLTSWGFARYGTDITDDIATDEAVLMDVNKLLESEYSGADPAEMTAVFNQLADSRDMLYTEDPYQVEFDSAAEKDEALLKAENAAEALGIGTYISFEDSDSTNETGKYYYTETLCTGAYMYGLSLLMSGTRDYENLLSNLANLGIVFPDGSVYSTGLTDLLNVFTTNLGATVYPHMTVCYYAIVETLEGDTDYSHQSDETGVCKYCGKTVQSAGADAQESVEEAETETENMAAPDGTAIQKSKSAKLKRWFLIVGIAFGIVILGFAISGIVRLSASRKDQKHSKK